jgi:hypothetical protein
MNFYTKVLSKFAATDGIAITGRSASLPERADVLLTRVAQADVTARRLGATEHDLLQVQCGAASLFSACAVRGEAIGRAAKFAAQRQG